MSPALLDLDGTLADPGIGIFRCIAFALEKLGLPVPAEVELRRWIGPPLLTSFASYFEAIGADADAGAALELYRQRYAAEGIHEVALYPGIPALLQALSGEGIRLLLATSKPAVFARRVVSNCGLDGWLSGVYGSELDGTRTDKAELLEHIIGCEGLDAGRCAMVGDRKHDMLAARYHGMTAIGVLWGYGTERELRDAGAHDLVMNPEQLRLRLMFAEKVP